ncbi:MAG: aminopeptidase N [Gammaproteobacteria bacterium]|nr:aminopeptidase N [Gammaproteobacteria bacterium]
MKNAQARTTYLKDYQPPAFTIETTDLNLDLFEDHAKVVATLSFRRNQHPDAPASDTLILSGSHQVLESLELEGRILDSGDYLLDEESLTLPALSKLLGYDPEQFNLVCTTRIEPQNNTALEGLYKSKKMFCTQCEAEGFRRITYYLDRPDVMSRFTTTIVADSTRYPVLLSNGNCVAQGISEEDSTRHWVRWEDPFRKPSYLFAVVAGDLKSHEDNFITSSGRKIDLRIFVEEKDLNKVDHAMASLKKAMRWDEEKYGREYDLDIFMIVAVDDFNMGAMENKGLNIFNTSCVLANTATTTDAAFQRVESVVAHEYFHNWSGNRVTCRDWFQLSLKEGFTVFRDSEFSADMGSRMVKRVQDVAFLKTVQFAEDAGPMAHSVRPGSYMEISNFYTVTIYEKGAEVVRMMHLLLGDELFRKGTDIYFDSYDGQAVTMEDFVRAMEDASGIDLGQFRRWYDQAGTPVLNVEGHYEANERRFTLKVKQHCPPTPQQPKKEPFHIPLRMGLLGEDGKELALHLQGETVGAAQFDRTLSVTGSEQEFVFEDIESRPVPSLLRNFSAPIRLVHDYTESELQFLMIHDSDDFNRWHAAQDLAIKVMNRLQADRKASRQLELSSSLLAAFEGVLLAAMEDEALDKAMLAHLLSLPTESILIEQAQEADIEGIHMVREYVANTLASKNEAKFAALFESNQFNGPFSIAAEAIACRSLKNCALAYLMRTGKVKWLDVCQQQYDSATNMTDQLAALRLLAHSNTPSGRDAGREALAKFYQQWNHEALVVDQWLGVQASDPDPGTQTQVKVLMKHPAFSLKNPNKVRALIGTFCGQNHVNFHYRDGEGYEFLADRVIELDQLNPQVAARLITPLTRWEKYDTQRQALIQAQLLRIKSVPGLSRDVFEVVEKSTVHFPAST